MSSGVTGIGGLFFRSKNPEARAAWYQQHLGISAGRTGIWQQDTGMTVFAPFPADSDYFAADQQFMLNLRATDIEQLAARLESEGIPAERRDEWNTGEYGTFARIHDLEGLAIELWQPPAESA